MTKKMLISALEAEELRVALVEDGRLEAFYVEVAAKEQTRGNIYKGVVARVEPGLQAAFVDYGAARHGFLQVGDLRPELWPAGKGERGAPLVQEVLRKGQELLVQVVKEETGTKGASLTTFFSIPGQALVLTPGREGGGVSRKIEDEAERARLRDMLGELKRPDGVGVIARTAVSGMTKREVGNNFRILVRLWEDIQRRGKKAKAPALIHREEELAVRTVRDLFTADVSEVLVDNPEVFARLEAFVALVNPKRKAALKLYKDSRPIFSKYDIEAQLETVYQSTVRLNCGGSIVIQPTEALVSVDVNSGKATRAKEIEDTALLVNLEAASEIARQLRLRDLGGLVVIDFIDMRDSKHRNQVLKQLKDELKKDKAKTTLGRISRFGLLEMSRQRIRPPIDFGATRSCPTCGGRGMVRTVEALGRGVLRSLRQKLRGMEGGLKARVNPEVAGWLLNQRRSELAWLEMDSRVCLEVTADHRLGPEEFSLDRSEATWTLPEVEEPAPVEAVAPAVETAQPVSLVEDEPPADEPAAPADSAGAGKSKSANRRRRRRRSAGAGTVQGEAAAASLAPAAEAAPATPDAPPSEPAGEAGEAGEKPAARRRKRRRSGSSRRRSKARQEEKESGAGSSGGESPQQND